jgi:hypothetical protein
VQTVNLDPRFLIGANVALAQGYTKLEKENTEFRVAILEFLRGSDMDKFKAFAESKHLKG